uniref:Uncharacterized protein n=1 Tax=Parascaris equorum TaxID=6256 RepID=A0A914RZ72_PAREQ
MATQVLVVFNMPSVRSSFNCAFWPFAFMDINNDLCAGDGMFVFIKDTLYGRCDDQLLVIEHFIQVAYWEVFKKSRCGWNEIITEP